MHLPLGGRHRPALLLGALCMPRKVGGSTTDPRMRQWLHVSRIAHTPRIMHAPRVVCPAPRACPGVRSHQEARAPWDVHPCARTVGRTRPGARVTSGVLALCTPRARRGAHASWCVHTPDVCAPRTARSACPMHPGARAPKGAGPRSTHPSSWIEAYSLVGKRNQFHARTLQHFPHCITTWDWTLRLWRD